MSSVYGDIAAELAPEAAEETRMLAVLQAVEECMSLLLGEASVLDGRGDHRSGVLALDLADRSVEVAGLGCCSHTLGVLLGEATGLDHLVEPLDESDAGLWPAWLSGSWVMSGGYRDTMSLSSRIVSCSAIVYGVVDSRLRTGTVEGHRRAVREATPLDTTAALWPPARGSAATSLSVSQHVCSTTA